MYTYYCTCMKEYPQSLVQMIAYEAATSSTYVICVPFYDNQGSLITHSYYEKGAISNNVTVIDSCISS